MKAILVTIWIFFSFLTTAYANSLTIGNSKDLRLYTLDCGSVTVHDIASFSDTGAYPHEAKQLSTPCFFGNSLATYRRGHFVRRLISHAESL